MSGKNDPEMDTALTAESAPKLSKPKRDKVAHFFLGLAGTYIIAFLLAPMFGDMGSIIAAVVAIVVFSIGKELYDKLIKKTFFDMYDIAACVVGIIISVITWIAL